MFADCVVVIVVEVVVEVVFGVVVAVVGMPYYSGNIYLLECPRE